ncbi:MAG: hypothetical protein HY901_28895 [Deltaproteobacteria bacterium]|nr:hypothetical protein [Deltaproteobacteria bacterium]
MASTSDADAIAFGRLAVHVGRAWSVGAALVAGGGPGALAGHEYAGQLRLGAQREVPLGLVSLLAGLEAGGGAIHHGSQGQAELDWVGVAALRLGLRLNLGERVGIEIVGEGSATIDDSYLPTPAGGATLGVAIAL